VGIPAAFFPFADGKGVKGLPPLKELLKSQYLYEFGLRQTELVKIEKLIGDVYNNKIKTLNHLLPFDEGITNYHRREPYDNYVERRAEESFQNPVTVYNNMGSQEEILKKLGFITIDKGIQKYLLNGDRGFIPFGFSIDEENRLLSYIFKESSELERIVKKELRDYVFKDYLKLHKKFYKDRPIVWKLGNRDRGFLVHYHNLNEKTKSNILSFLRNRIKETASRQMRNENKSFRDLLKIIESKNFELNIDDGVVKNSAIF